jgi:hypothetical protein
MSEAFNVDDFINELMKYFEIMDKDYKYYTKIQIKESEHDYKFECLCGCTVKLINLKSHEEKENHKLKILYNFMTDSRKNKILFDLIKNFYLKKNIYSNNI